MKTFFPLLFLLTQAASSSALESLDCIIEARGTIEVGSAVAGVLEEVLVERNDTVKQGQLIAKLHSGVEQANVKLARKRAASKVNIQDRKARYELSLRSQKRIESLAGKNMVSELDADEARTKTVVAQYEIEKAKLEHAINQLELERAREILALRSILSPVDGIVVERLKSAGEYVETQALLKLAQVDPLNVEVIAPLALYGKIQQGMRAKVFPEQPIGGTYEAEVVIVDQVLDAASGTFGIRLHLPNQDYKIPAGLGCRIEFMN